MPTEEEAKDFLEYVKRKLTVVLGVLTAFAISDATRLERRSWRWRGSGGAHAISFLAQ